MRISDGSSDVCSSDLILLRVGEGFRDALYSPENIAERALVTRLVEGAAVLAGAADPAALGRALTPRIATNPHARQGHAIVVHGFRDQVRGDLQGQVAVIEREDDAFTRLRSEEHTSELQSLMRKSYAVFCLKKKTTNKNYNNTQVNTQA